jgi:hypothetical protein
MAKKAPYFVIPYDAIGMIELHDKTRYHQSLQDGPNAFDRNPFSDDFEVKIMLSKTLDTWSSKWNYSGIKQIFNIVKKNVSDAEFYRDHDLRNMFLQLQELIENVESIRTMHVMKQWNLTKLVPEKYETEKREVVDFTKLLENIDLIKAHYVPNKTEEVMDTKTGFCFQFITFLGEETDFVPIRVPESPEEEALNDMILQKKGLKGVCLIASKKCDPQAVIEYMNKITDKFDKEEAQNMELPDAAPGDILPTV